MTKTEAIKEIEEYIVAREKFKLTHPPLALEEGDFVLRVDRLTTTTTCTKTKVWETPNI